MTEIKLSIQKLGNESVYTLCVHCKNGCGDCVVKGLNHRYYKIDNSYLFCYGCLFSIVTENFKYTKPEPNSLTISELEPSIKLENELFQEQMKKMWKDYDDKNSTLIYRTNELNRTLEECKDECESKVNKAIKDMKKAHVEYGKLALQHETLLAEYGRLAVQKNTR